jgi:CRP-like cAMP-binding protein
VAASDRNATKFDDFLLAQLSAAERERLQPLFEPVDLPAKMVLCRIGKPIEYAVFPATAITSTYVEMPEGGSMEVGLMGSEGVVGLDLLYEARESARKVVVQVAGVGSRMRAEDFTREIVGRTELYKILLRYSYLFMGMIAQSGACNATHVIEQRLARWLLLVHDRVHHDRFDLTHEYLALMLGVRRAGVSGAANNLRLCGAIDYTRGKVRILDREALEGCACGCYPIIRRLFEAT